MMDYEDKRVCDIPGELPEQAVVKGPKEQIGQLHNDFLHSLPLLTPCVILSLPAAVQQRVEWTWDCRIMSPSSQPVRSLPSSRFHRRRSWPNQSRLAACG